LSDAISIKEAPPCCGQMLSDTLFIPNDANMDNTETAFLLLPDQNMAGKSTYMRQSRIIRAYGAIGSFVPLASGARLVTSLTGYYTRIGASYDLSSGRSTYRWR
jgi:DNA mismatch repair ATPase MutS